MNRFLDKIENMLGGLRDEGFLDVNSAALVPRLRERRGTVAQAPKRGVFIENETKTEVSTILQTAAERGIQLFIVCLLAFAGLRKSEIAGLRWDAVDFEAGRMSIWEQRKRNRRKKADRDEGEGTALVTDTKTEESHRELPLPPTLAAALKMVRRWQREMHLASGRRFGVKGEPPTHVVVNPSGGAVHPETVYERWADFVRTLGAAPEGSARTESAKTRADDERPPVIYLHLHAARDTCATLLALRGVLPHLIGAWLGHQPKGMIASPVTGEYIHGDWEFRVMVAEQWELIFGPIVTSCDMDKAMKSGKYQLSA
ncbi:site-specific integrase [Nocardia sp. BMG51109]|uniref:site-specific integrase n=1 Tax=Nocardia sp. BMG51109 TaxID=1056816 RepID=UPI0018DE2142|nr:site-specific integrase [Nocardia sp. BMG51109]